MQVIEFYEMSIHVCRKRHKFKYYKTSELKICKINVIDFSTKFHSIYTVEKHRQTGTQLYFHIWLRKQKSTIFHISKSNYEL
jgi:hypothetical protein